MSNELTEKIEAIKRRATTKFHNDHADGDLAIYDVVEEMSALIKAYGDKRELEGRIDERLSTLSRDGKLYYIDGVNNRTLTDKERLTELTNNTEG